MLKHSIGIAIFAFVLTIAVCCSAMEHVQKENIDFSVPLNWKSMGRASAEKIIKIQVAIKQSNVARLTVRHLYERS